MCKTLEIFFTSITKAINIKNHAALNVPKCKSCAKISMPTPTCKMIREGIIIFYVLAITSPARTATSRRPAVEICVKYYGNDVK